MQLLKINSLGSARIINTPDETDINKLYWKLCIELGATCYGPMVNSDILEGSDLVVYGIDNSFFKNVPENEYINTILDEKVYGSCICFSLIKDKGSYTIKGLSNEEMALIIAKTSSFLEADSMEAFS